MSMTSEQQQPVFEGVRNVLLDVDDTLWENNIFFLQSLDWFCRVGRQLGSPDRATIAMLNSREDFNIPRHGYGYDSYERSLVMALSMLVSRSGRGDLHGGLLRQALKWTRFLREHPIVWRPGVAESLPELCSRFRAIIVTKGHHGDQMAKVHRCGLDHLFDAAEVVPHKHEHDYWAVVKKHGLAIHETVMVGNSPRSDINMAKRAGLRTVFIPHPKTWFREEEPIEPHDPPTIRLHSFDELLGVLRA